MVPRAALIAVVLAVLLASSRSGSSPAPAPAGSAGASSDPRPGAGEPRVLRGFAAVALVEPDGGDVMADPSPEPGAGSDPGYPALPSISPDLAPSLEALLAPLRAVAPVVLTPCTGSVSAPAVTPTLIVPRTATPRSSPTPPPPTPAKATGSATVKPPPSTSTPVRVPTRTPTPQPAAAPAVAGCVSNANVTFYDCKTGGFCGQMYDGTVVYEGAAACSFDMALGTEFRITGDPTARTYRCEDRGLLKPTWVDIFFNDPADGWRWAAQAGRYGTLEILR